MELNAANGTTDTDVLIVGAGPVGLFLARECARRGLHWRLVEEKPGQSEHSKALAIFPRTLEIFDMSGTVAPFLEMANRVTEVAVISHERSLAELEFEPAETPYRFIAMVPQNITESILAKDLEERGGRIEYETAFVAAEERDGSVQATVDHRGERRELRAKFVVGCDGARSAVRQGMKVKLEGGEYRDEFMLADIETNAFRPPSELLLCPSELGPVALFPMSETRWRVVATIRAAEGDAPSLALTQRVLEERAPAGIEVRSLHWSSYFRIHHRHAAQLRIGRSFLAGDSAHLHSPFGGQGMNTGLHDAWNLVWKLDLSLRGHGNATLLDSYEAERLPAIRSVVEMTDLLTKGLGTGNKLAEVVRDTLIPVVSHLAFFQHAFVKRLSGLGVAYGGSPIVEGSGERHFDESLRGGGIHSRFVLVLGGDVSADDDGVKRLSMTFPEVLEVRTAQTPGIRLVRPDGYVAYAARRTDGVRTWEALRALLQKQTA